ncbi:MAG TPA: carboxypeptidase regulatory-like domain-containing protein [Bryobacteraceae bacterium]|nr:carboxypeptidase regulatory-like domain-containing protein [Bryobacteraceae bacterium]
MSRAKSSLGILFVLVWSTLSLAQSTGRISGTVVDPSGSVIANGAVICTNSETGLTRKVETNQDGLFVFPDLPIGRYIVAAQAQGFETARRDNISLLTGQSLDLKFSLSIGSSSQTVDVTAGAPLVETDASSVQTSVNQNQMQDLPLNGRNALQLTTLTPGTVLTNVGTESGQQDNTGLSVNGLRATQNNFQLDGTNYTNRFFDSVPTMPDPDALQEFTIQSSNYSAEYGGAGALIQLSTRSGSNEIHGTAFEFFRNTKLDARNFFNITRPPFKLNQFGGTAGGPIKKNKTFFFFSAQDTEQRSAPSPISITTPSAAERSGNFSSISTKIINPSTGKQFPGNIIPTSMFNPISVAVANALLPIPNSGTQYISTANQNLDDTQYLVKIDHAFSDKDHFSVRYFYDENNFQRPFNAPSGFYAENLFRNQTLTLNETHVFSPTLTAIFYASADRFARTQIPVDPGLQSLESFGQNVPLGTSVPVFPGIRLNISGFVDVFSGGALRQDPTTFEYRAQAVKVWGAHTFNFGSAFERTRVDANDYSYTPGDNTFNGQFTGSALADFYLGYESQFFQDNGRTFYLREDRPSLYVQDDWKVNRQFTLNLGLRWDPWLPPIDLHNSLTAFVPGMQSTVAPNAPRGLLYPGDPGISSSIFRRDWKDFAPRVGIAWNIGGNQKTVLRAAYGIFYSFPEGLLYQRTDATQPTDLYSSIPAPQSFTNPYLGYSGGDPFPRGHILPSGFSTYRFLEPVSGGMLDPSSKVGYTQNWNFTLEHQFSGNTALSVSYVGNHAVDIMGSRQFNPAIFLAGATVANENSRRLYPGLGAVELASSYVYDEFESLQVNATKRFSKDLTLLSNFTWGKTIDDTSSATEGNSGPANPFNFSSARGPADFDQEFRFNLSVAYATPHVNVTGFRSVLLNDWQVNGITSLYSGLPFTVVSGTDRSLSGIGNDYSDLIGNTARPAGVSQIQEYFNTAAFTQAVIGSFGDIARNSLRGPGFFDVDASIFKNFLFTERYHLQFRAEAFNIENRPNFSNPNATVSTSVTFGRITAANNPRVLQFALKMFF